MAENKNNIKNEAIAGNKSNASTKRTGSNYQAATGNATSAHIQTGKVDNSKFSAGGDNQPKGYHSVNEGPGSGAGYVAVDEENSINQSHSTAVDEMGRSQDTYDAQTSIQNAGSWDNQDRPFNNDQASDNQSEGQGQPVGGSDNGNPSGINTKPTYPSGLNNGTINVNASEEGRYTNEKGKAADAGINTAWTTKNHKPQGSKMSAVRAVTSLYSPSDTNQGAREVKDNAKKAAIASGATGVARIVRKKSIMAGVYSKAHAETADKYGLTGKGYLTETRSLGNKQKDIQNNINVLNKELSGMGIDTTGWKITDYNNALLKGSVYNKAGKNIDLRKNERAKDLLKMRKDLEKKKNAMKATGSWRDDLKFMAGDIFGEADAVQGYRTVKAMVKTGTGAVKAVAAVNGAVAKTTIKAAGAGVRTVSHVKSAVYKTKAFVATDKAEKKKWQVKAGIEKRNRIKNKVKTENAARKVGDIIAHPIQNLKGFIKARARAAGKAMGRGAKKGFKALAGNPKLLAAVLGICACLILSVVGPNILMNAIGALWPSSGNESLTSSDFANGMTEWDEAKKSIQETMVTGSNDIPAWLKEEWPVLREKGYSEKNNYTVNFVFAGYNFYGTDNMVCKENGGRDTEDESDEENKEDTESGSGGGSSGTAMSLNDSNYDAKKIEEKAKDNSTGRLVNNGISKKVLSWSGGRIRDSWGHDETYYNMDMANIVGSLNKHARGKYGLDDDADYWERSDGVKMYGKKGGTSYVIVAADLSVWPRGSLVMTTAGPGIVADTGVSGKHFDIAVNWTSTKGVFNGKYKTKNSGNVDIWNATGSIGGSSLTSGGNSDDGIQINSYNYFRGMLAMVQTVTDNDGLKEHQTFFNDYCNHILKNSIAYTLYCADTSWHKQIDSNTDYDPHNLTEVNIEGRASSPDSFFGLDEQTMQLRMGAPFNLFEYDRSYDYYTKDGEEMKRLTSITYGVKLNILNGGLWGDYTLSGLGPDGGLVESPGLGDYLSNDDESNSPGRAGVVASVPVSEKAMASVGLFDTEEYKFSVNTLSGESPDFLSDNFGDDDKSTMDTELGDDDYIHKIGGGYDEAYAGDKKVKVEKSEFYITDKDDKDYVEWDGYKGFNSVGDKTTLEGNFISDGGGEAEYVEANYEMSDSFIREAGITMDGIYNIDNTQDDTDGGAASNPLTDAELQALADNVAKGLTENDAPERADVIKLAMSYIGKVTYTQDSRRYWNKNTDPLRYTDCSGFVSYCAYKGGAKNCGFNSAQYTGSLAGLCKGNRKVNGKDNLRPGDIMVKYHGDGATNHAVMYVGTIDGKFTVIENGGTNSGVHLSKYASPEDFFRIRGGGSGQYNYFLNFYGD